VLLCYHSPDVSHQYRVYKKVSHHGSGTKFHNVVILSHVSVQKHKILHKVVEGNVAKLLRRDGVFE